MTLEVKHLFESEVADGDDDTIVQPSDWNAAHNLTMATARILGRTTAEAGAVEELEAADVRTFLNVEDGADVTDATNVDAAGAVMASDFDANTILAANTDNTPAPVTIAEQRIVGRITSGNIAALDPSQVRTLLNVEDGADVTDATNVASAGAVMESDYNAHTILAATTDNTPTALEIAESRFVGRASGGNIAALDATAAKTILAIAQADVSGLTTASSPQFTGIELGHASDTTLTRSAAGIVAVEGNDLAKTEPGVNAQTGSSYTLVIGDKGLIVTMSNASPNTLTIPANSAVAFPVGTIINVLQLGSGVTTIEGDTGVTVNGESAGEGEIGNRYQGVALLKVATDTWVASGDIEIS